MLLDGTMGGSDTLVAGAHGSGALGLGECAGQQAPVGTVESGASRVLRSPGGVVRGLEATNPSAAFVTTGGGLSPFGASRARHGTTIALHSASAPVGEVDLVQVRAGTGADQHPSDPPDATFHAPVRGASGGSGVAGPGVDPEQASASASPRQGWQGGSGGGGSLSDVPPSVLISVTVGTLGVGPSTDLSPKGGSGVSTGVRVGRAPRRVVLPEDLPGLPSPMHPSPPAGARSVPSTPTHTADAMRGNASSWIPRRRRSSAAASAAGAAVVAGLPVGPRDGGGPRTEEQSLGSASGGPGEGVAIGSTGGSTTPQAVATLASSHASASGAGPGDAPSRHPRYFGPYASRPNVTLNHRALATDAPVGTGRKGT